MSEMMIHYEMAGDEVLSHMLMVHDYDVRGMSEADMQRAHVFEHECRKKTHEPKVAPFTYVTPEEGQRDHDLWCQSFFPEFAQAA